MEEVKPMIQQVLNSIQQVNNCLQRERNNEKSIEGVDERDEALYEEARQS